MDRLLVFLAVDRETTVVAALVALAVAGLVVSAGAWLLLRRERGADAPGAPRTRAGEDRSG